MNNGIDYVEHNLLTQLSTIHLANESGIGLQNSRNFFLRISFIKFLGYEIKRLYPKLRYLNRITIAITALKIFEIKSL